jgi:hypothetical protein
MGAEQFWQGTMFGAVTLSWLALRMLRLLLLNLRFGTATIYSLSASPRSRSKIPWRG